MHRHAALFVIFGAALWGTDALFRRPLTGVLSPVTIVLLEHCVLSLAVAPVVLRLRREFRNLRPRDYGLLAIIAVGGSVIATILFTFAMKYGNPTVVILLQKTQPLFTVILARLFLGERPAAWFWPWLAAAVAGAFLISVPDLGPGLRPDAVSPAVAASAIGASLLWGSATVCGRHLISRTSFPFLTGLRFVFALPALAVLFLLQPVAQREILISLPISLTVLAMALISGLAALLLYYKGLQGTPASVASVCELAFPLTAVAVNWIALDARLSATQLLGSFLLVVSVTRIALLNARRSGDAASAAKSLRS